MSDGAKCDGFQKDPFPHGLGLSACQGVTSLSSETVNNMFQYKPDHV
jgi:hypothetical protein